MAEQNIDIAKIGELANIELSVEEQAKFREQLGAIVECVGKISEVDVSGVEPTVCVISTSNAFRDDTLVPHFDRETALQNSPQRIDNEFKVPRIVE